MGAHERSVLRFLFFSPNGRFESRSVRKTILNEIISMRKLLEILVEYFHLKEIFFIILMLNLSFYQNFKTVSSLCEKI